MPVNAQVACSLVGRSLSKQEFVGGAPWMTSVFCMGEAEYCIQACHIRVGHLISEGDICIGVCQDIGWRRVSLGVCHVEQAGCHMDVDVESRVQAWAIGA